MSTQKLGDIKLSSNMGFDYVFDHFLLSFLLSFSRFSVNAGGILFGIRNPAWQQKEMYKTFL